MVPYLGARAQVRGFRRLVCRMGLGVKDYYTIQSEYDIQYRARVIYALEAPLRTMKTRMTNRRAVMADNLPRLVLSAEQEAAPREAGVNLVASQGELGDFAAKLPEISNLIVMTPDNACNKSTLQKVWGKVAERTLGKLLQFRPQRRSRISPSVSIYYKRSKKAAGQLSDWNTSAIRRVPYGGVQARGTPKPTPRGATKRVPASAEQAQSTAGSPQVSAYNKVAAELQVRTARIIRSGKRNR